MFWQQSIPTIKNQTLLSRKEFKEQVFDRNKGICIFCKSPAVNAHHILDRKLFPDGGYYLNNGSAVCEDHHWKCESTEISVPEVLKAAKIDCPVLPDGFDPNLEYDKWGNQVLEDGFRKAGPLFHDDGARKILTKGNVLWKIRKF